MSGSSGLGRKVQLGCGGVYAAFLLLSLVLCFGWLSSRDTMRETLNQRYALWSEDRYATDVTRAKLLAEAGAQRTLAEIRLYLAERPDEAVPQDYACMLGSSYGGGADVYQAHVRSRDGDTFTIEVKGEVLMEDYAASSSQAPPKVLSSCEAKVTATVTPSGFEISSKTLEDTSPPPRKIGSLPE